MSTEANSNAPFAEAVTEIERIDKDILVTFTVEQLKVISEVIHANKRWTRHPIGLRFSFPVYFARFFVVFLIGRDRRWHVQSIEDARRSMMMSASIVLFFYCLTLGAAITLFMGLYVIKGLLGIDLIPGWHLTDWFQ